MTAGLLLLLAAGTAGAVLAWRLRLPFWGLTGSVAGACIATVASGGAVAVPGWWSTSAQILVGTAVGASIGPGIFREFRAVLLPGSLVVVSIVGVGVACGWAIAASGRADPAVAVLGMMPGGVGEMVAAATALDANSALVAGMHVVRLLVVLSTLPLLVRWAGRWSPPGGAGEH